jgi:hypothetical protein
LNARASTSSGQLNEFGAPEVVRFYEPEIDANRQIDGNATEYPRVLADAPDPTDPCIELESPSETTSKSSGNCTVYLALVTA